MFRTRLTEQYGLQYPIVSAGMGFLALPPLAAAVSNAGGLGLIGAAPAPPPAVQAMIQATRALTSRPFGVDFVVENTAFGPSTTREHIDACMAEGVKLVVFFWNLPPREWIERLHSSGAKVWLQCGSVEVAREAVAAGCDAIIAQGREAGGHCKSVSGIFTILPAIVDAVKVPVLAAGGIADGRGLAAALALGAEGVCVGTRLIASQEAYAHEEYKRRVLAATQDDIALTHIFGPEWPDAPMRVIRNRVVRDWTGRDQKTPPPPAPPQFIGKTKLGEQEYNMPKFSAALPTPLTSGDFEEMCLAAGESAGLTKKIQPAGEIIREIAEQAKQVTLQLVRVAPSAVK